jgi:hypothetical protein
MHHSTSWFVSGLRSSRIVGSSATNRPRLVASLSSSAFEWATIATGSSGSGITQGSTRSGLSLSERVSPVSALCSLATATMSPATAWLDRALDLAQRRGERADALVDVVVLVAVVRGEVAGHVHRGVGATVPEKTRTSETRPT